MFQTFVIFQKKNQVVMVKNVKNCSKSFIMWGNCVFEAVFYVFHHVDLIFFENNKSLEHLNVLLRIFLFQVFFKILMLIFGLY